MKLAIVGTGYVGLVTGTCLAETGNQVTCVDIDQNKIERLKDGIIPIYEPGLEPLVKSNFAEKRLHFTTSINDAIDTHELLMIAVGTPPNEDGSADLKHVVAVATAIGKQMKEYKLIVTKSTVPVGTGDLVRKAVQTELDKRGLKIQFSVASNPEFLKEGAAVADFMKPDRIVIGCNDVKGEEILRDLYAPFLRNGHPLIAMDLKSAELCKYASNAMLATKISFMNELSRIAENVGADVIRVRQGMGADKRIGYEFTHAGLGYGGSCFPKDVKALVSTAKQNGLNPVLLDAVEEVNRTQRLRFLDKIKKHFNGKLTGKKIALWGLSFKPETDDIREAPALDLVEEFLDGGAQVAAYDPIAAKNTMDHFKGRPGFTTVDHMYEALQGADLLVLCTEWKPFRAPDFEKMKGLMSSAVIFDGRNQYEPETMRELGFKYVCIGRA
jgi:UDPglucose 6-dehydrogenase